MITENYLTISPAYGRDYKSQAAVEQDFRDGKDFRMESMGQGGTHCSISDFAKGVMISIRYAKMSKVINVKV